MRIKYNKFNLKFIQKGAKNVTKSLDNDFYIPTIIVSLLNKGISKPPNPRWLFEGRAKKVLPDGPNWLTSFAGEVLMI